MALVDSVPLTAPSIAVTSAGQARKTTCSKSRRSILLSYQLAIERALLEPGLLFFLMTYPLSGQRMSWIGILTVSTLPGLQSIKPTDIHVISRYLTLSSGLEMEHLEFPAHICPISVTSAVKLVS
jgi:hypothetical protein